MQKTLKKDSPKKPAVKQMDGFVRIHDHVQFKHYEERLMQLELRIEQLEQDLKIIEEILHLGRS